MEHTDEKLYAQFKKETGDESSLERVQIPSEPLANYVKWLQDKVLKPSISIDVYQQDWMPGFGMMTTIDTDDSGILHPVPPIQEGAKPVICINVGSMLTAKMVEDLDHSEFIEHVIETYFHELIHVLEHYITTDFSEERVDELTQKYMEKYHEQKR